MNPSDIPKSLTPQQRREFLATLGQIPVLSHIEGRNLLLKGLPRNLVEVLSRSTIPIIELADILEACERWERSAAEKWPVFILIENAFSFAYNPEVAAQLHDLYQKLGGQILALYFTLPLPPLMSADWRAELRKALRAAFPTLPEFRWLVERALGHPLHEIAQPRSVAEAVSQVLVWAAAQDRLVDLLRKALQVAPHDPSLRQLADQLDAESWGAEGPPPPPPPAPPGPASGGSYLPADLSLSRVQRYADIQAPGSVAAAQQFQVSVSLTQQPRPDLVDVEPVTVHVTHDAVGPTGAPPVIVSLYTTAFTVLGSARAELAILLDQDSGPVHFALRPNPGSTGQQQISVTFMQEQDILKRMLMEIEILPGAPVHPIDAPGPVPSADASVAEPPPSVRYHMPLALDSGHPPGDNLPKTPPPDVVIYVDRVSHKGREQLHFRYLWLHGERLGDIDAGTSDLHDVIPWARAQYAELSQYATVAPAESPAARERAAAPLARIGQGLYDRLFPPQLKTAYAQFAPHTRSLLIYSTEPWIPWELIKPFGENLRDEDSDFLCARFTLGRWLTGEETARVPHWIVVRRLCPVLPPTTVAMGRERAYLAILCRHWLAGSCFTPGPRDCEEFTNLLGSGAIQLFHIGTHGHFDLADPEKSTIRLGASVVTPADIIGRDVQSGLRRATPLMVINACHSGRQGLALSGIGGWADKFLRFGCSGFLGTNWEVDDGLAAKFTEHFYEALRAQLPVGEACRQARLALREKNPGNSTWLAYVLYGHPLAPVLVDHRS